jgi:hypothetical protein
MCLVLKAGNVLKVHHLCKLVYRFTEVLGTYHGVDEALSLVHELFKRWEIRRPSIVEGLNYNGWV